MNAPSRPASWKETKFASGQTAHTSEERQVMTEFEQWLNDTTRKYLQELGSPHGVLAIFGASDRVMWHIKFSADTRDLCNSFRDEHGARLSDATLLQMIEEHLTVAIRETQHVMPPDAIEMKDRILLIAEEFYASLQRGEDVEGIAIRYERALRTYQGYVSRWTRGFIQPSADDARLMDGARAETSWAEREMYLVVQAFGGLLDIDRTPESDDEKETE